MEGIFTNPQLLLHIPGDGSCSSKDNPEDLPPKKAQNIQLSITSGNMRNDKKRDGKTYTHFIFGNLLCKTLRELIQFFLFE